MRATRRCRAGVIQLIQAQQFEPHDGRLQDELLAMPRRCAGSGRYEACHRVSPRGGKLPPLPRYGERFTKYLVRVTRDCVGPAA